MQSVELMPMSKTEISKDNNLSYISSDESEKDNSVSSLQNNNIELCTLFSKA